MRRPTAMFAGRTDAASIQASKGIMMKVKSLALSLALSFKVNR